MADHPGPPRPSATPPGEGNVEVKLICYYLNRFEPPRPAATPPGEGNVKAHILQ